MCLTLYFKSLINKKEIDDFKEYEEIEIYNFESLPLRYSIFLDAIKKNYNINIDIIQQFVQKFYMKTKGPSDFFSHLVL